MTPEQIRQLQIELLEDAIHENIGMIGRVFGRLTVVAVAGKSEMGHVTYDTLCDCGRAHLNVTSTNLRKGRVQSCGCARKDAARRVSALGGAAYAAKMRTSHAVPA